MVWVMTKAVAPDIYEHLNYRDYMQVLFDYKSATDKTFSHRNLCRKAGLKSPSYFLMVIQGKRNLTSNTINRFVKAIDLEPGHARYFERLVLFNQARDEREREFHLTRLAEMRPKKKFKDIENDQMEFFSNLLLVVIHQLASVPDFNEDPQWIARRLRIKATPTEVRKALETLERLKLLKRKKNGKLEPAEWSLSTSIEVTDWIAYRFHSDLLGHASEALSKLTHRQRDFSAITFPLPMDKLDDLKDRIRQFQDELMEWAEEIHLDNGSRKNPQTEEIFQLNFQGFPATNKPDSGSKS